MIVVDNKKIRQLREKEKTTTADVAGKLGLSQPYYSQIENGHKTPNIPVLKRIANHFGVLMDDLVIDTDHYDTA